MQTNSPRLIYLASLMILSLIFKPAAAAERIEPPPAELEGVGVTENLNAMVPLDLEFVDEEGRKVVLGNYVRGEKPVALTLNYYECPMLCTLQLNGLVEALKEVPLLPGKDFEIVTVSINPLETPPLAKLKKQNYLKEYGCTEAWQGWHFLTGKRENIRALTDSVGFHYRFDPKSGEFAHVAVLVLLTPDGRISRYIYDVLYDPKILRLSLIESSQGKIGTPLDQVFLYCFRYNSETGKYTLVVMNIVRLAGGLTIITLGFVLGIFWARELILFRRKSSNLLKN